MNQPLILKPPALLSRNFINLFISGLFFGLAFWPYVLLPVYLQNLGANLPMVGILMGAAPLAGIVVRPFVGTALDRIGLLNNFVQVFIPVGQVKLLNQGNHGLFFL